MTTIETAFNEHAAALRTLGDELEKASAIRYEPSPGMVSRGDGPHNPTLDTVLDPRRAAVSAEITRVAVALWPMTRSLIAHSEQLRTAVARWEGEAAPSQRTPTA